MTFSRHSQGVVIPARRRLVGGLLACFGVYPLLAAAVQTVAPDDRPSAPLAAEFARDVTPCLQIPAGEIGAYEALLSHALSAANLNLLAVQYAVVVDRNTHVQAAFLFWGSAGSGWQLVGATPVSTGLPGRYEHFITPLGVFDHSLENPDFRAEGTKNKLGFRGYGAKGMRIYDFGWVKALRGWGDRKMGVLRFQMHATDPLLAEPLLGSARSEGCVRIPATLNAFIDHHGLLDAAYEKAVADGSSLWVLQADREATPTPGRYLVVVDSGRTQRPTWSPSPQHRDAIRFSVAAIGAPD